jgi:hypothetical protein
MGLGIGINCKACGRQLCYDTDCKEIVRHTEILESGEQVVTLHPVLCHDCALVVEAICAQI